ncbi:AAA family ATPase [Ezakiella coagulans]|uniref:AAA family ATPase n=1 Tax=Ezakiella coagulans TaxID=46507 RepID=UPI00288B20BE|nr:AAA family ATPase [Ezakiella coagulans]
MNKSTDNRKISTIIIKNFQSHRHTVLNLDEHVNVILGSSDVGKTAILRALGWVFFNEPQGTAFIRAGETSTSVELIYSDGYSVKRIRNKKFNGYHINHPDFDEPKKLSGFGSSVPEEIQEITGVRKFEIADKIESSITYQTQLEGAFLLSESSIKKAKAIGAISNVNIIDRAIQIANSNIKDFRKNINTSEEALKNSEEQIKEYDNLDERKQNLEKVKNLYSELIQKNKMNENLSVLNQRLDNNIERIKTEENTIKSLSFVDETYKTYYKLNSLLIKGADYYNKFMNLRNNEALYETNMKIINNTNFLEDANPKFENVVSLIRRFNTLTNINKDLERVEESQKRNEEIISGSKNLDKIYDTVKYTQNILNKFQLLQNLHNRLITIERTIAEVEKDIDPLFIENLSKYLNYVINLDEKFNDYNTLYNSLFSKNSDIEYSQNIINNLDNEINEKLNSYLEVLQKSNICPMCGSKITEEHIEKIRKEYTNEL